VVFRGVQDFFTPKLSERSERKFWGQTYATYTRIAQAQKFFPFLVTLCEKALALTKRKFNGNVRYFFRVIVFAPPVVTQCAHPIARLDPTINRSWASIFISIITTKKF
jgi:hypothetical protein